MNLRYKSGTLEIEINGAANAQEILDILDKLTKLPSSDQSQIDAITASLVDSTGELTTTTTDLEQAVNKEQ